MKLGNKGLGTLFVWISVLSSIFMYLMMYLILNPMMEVTLLGFSDTINGNTSQSSVALTSYILPAWHISPWLFAIVMVIIGVLVPVLSTPEGNYY